MLLIDEIDRADEAFEAYLLELLSDFQLSIPELGTVHATSRPLVVITSNGTRELSDALRRRCLYQYIDYPDFDKELAIVRKKAPNVAAELAQQIVAFVQSVRRMDLQKKPGIAETLDWTAALLRLGISAIDERRRRAHHGNAQRLDQDARRPRRLSARGRRAAGGGMLSRATPRRSRPGRRAADGLPGLPAGQRVCRGRRRRRPGAADRATCRRARFPASLRWSLQALLCGRSDEWQRFDELFDAWFLPANRWQRPERRDADERRIERRVAQRPRRR